MQLYVMTWVATVIMIINLAVEKSIIKIIGYGLVIGVLATFLKLYGGA